VGTNLIELVLITAATPSIAPFNFVYSARKNQASALRVGPWKLVTSIYSQCGDGYQVSPTHPLLFQVEHDLSESIYRAAEQPKITEQSANMLAQKQHNITAQGSYRQPY